MLNILLCYMQRDELKREPTPKETFIKCYTKNDGTCVGKKADETMVRFMIYYFV